MFSKQKLTKVNNNQTILKKNYHLITIGYWDSFPLTAKWYHRTLKCKQQQNVVYPKSPTVQQSTANIVVHELEGSWKIGKITEKCSCKLIEEMTILHRSEMQFNLLLTFVFSFCLGICKCRYWYDKYLEFRHLQKKAFVVSMHKNDIFMCNIQVVK